VASFEELAEVFEGPTTSSVVGSGEESLDSMTELLLAGTVVMGIAYPRMRSGDDDSVMESSVAGAGLMGSGEGETIMELSVAGAGGMEVAKGLAAIASSWVGERERLTGSDESRAAMNVFEIVSVSQSICVAGAGMGESGGGGDVSGITGSYFVRN